MDYSKLAGIIPDEIINELPALVQYGVNGPLRLSHLLGQCMEETGNFTVFTENLNYSGEALWTLFHKHFESASEALTYARQPERIANRIYANRMGNGDESSGDGWKYRGRGALQTTGKVNYEAFGKFAGIDLVTDPDALLPDYALASAAFFFHTNNLWDICDKGIDTGTITEVTKHVNGGTLNLDKRIIYTLQVHKALRS